jgi:Chitobiase/beta-hexosaminidase C-terminal domain
MTVISVVVIGSEDQVMAGIPKSVSITTNIPALIFYTLDGCAPTTNSAQYVGPIFLPTNQLIVILNVFATNGTDSSPIITEIYQTDMVDGNARFSRNDTNQPPGYNLQGLYPFGDNGIQPGSLFGNPANVGVTVDNPALPATPTGFDGFGNPTGFTNNPYDLVNYNIVYSTQNAEGETGPDIGNLPANVKLPKQWPSPSIGPEQTIQNFTNLFDPKAFVIFQDSTTENPNDPPIINREHFTLENNERARDGNAYFNTGLDAPPTSGTFLRSHYNPRTNMTTYYYLDTWTNKWIISTQPNVTTGPYDGNLSIQATTGGQKGAGFVFLWQEFTRRVLF